MRSSSKPSSPTQTFPTLRSSVIVLLGYVLLTLILTHPLPFNLTSAVPNDIGDPLLNTWILAWDAHALLTDLPNLFQANIFHPLPNTLAYSEHLISTALLALPLQLISAEPIVAYNVSLLITFPLAAYGMYLLILRWTGHRAAAFIAGLIFGFAPYRFAAIAHLQLLTFQWLPFALIFLDKLIASFELRITNYSKSRHLKLTLALITCLLLQLLASWYLALYTGLIMVIYLLVALISRRLTGSTLLRLIPAFGLTGLVTLPFVLPYVALLDELRQARPLSLALSLAAAPTDFLAAASFNMIAGSLTAPFRTRPGFTEETVLFLGLIGPLLAVLALRSWASNRQQPRSPLVSFLAPVLLLILTLLLTLPQPYELVSRLIPFSTVIRVPARWVIPALFALAHLAALGYVWLARQVTVRYAGPWPAGILLAGGAGLLVVESLSIPIPLAPVENRDQLNPAYPWLAAQPAPLTLIELPLHSAPAPEFPEVKRLYASTVGWWSLVNGYSGYTPPRQPRLAQQLANFPAEDAVTALTHLAERSDPLYLLVHPGETPFDRTQWETQDRWQAERQPGLLPAGQFNGDYLYQVLPLEPAPTSTLPLATFADGSLELLSYQVSLSGSPTLRLYWQTTAPQPEDGTIFIHLRTADGFVRSQADSPPVSGQYPLRRWSPGQIIQDIHSLPSDDFSQVDHIAVGWYDPATNERLPAFKADGQPWPDNAVILGVLAPESSSP